jgi:glycosyltransferase involved in cell wall biosynthesis
MTSPSAARSANPIRLAWFAIHPIQYQAPLLRAIAQCPDIELTALFLSDLSTRAYLDEGFGRRIEWDVPLLEGYRYEFLPGTGREVDAIRPFQPRVRALSRTVSRRHYDAVLVQGWQHYAMIQAAWLAARAGLTVLMRCEASDHLTPGASPPARLLRETIVRALLRRVDRCMAIGTRNRDFYLARKVPSERIGSMPYCVDNDYFRSRAAAADLAALRDELRLEGDRPVVLYAGKLTHRKLPDVLLEAYRRLGEARPYLVFAGDGELASDLAAAAAASGLRDARFAGFRNQQELPAFYALADVFVLPSVDEPWGLVVNEAMNAGCAIVVTDQVGCAADLVREGENGFVVPGRSAQQLAEALSACLEQQRYRAMGARSLEIIRHWGIGENVSGLRAALGLDEGRRETRH